MHEILVLERWVLHSHKYMCADSSSIRILFLLLHTGTLYVHVYRSLTHSTLILEHNRKWRSIINQYNISHVHNHNIYLLSGLSLLSGSADHINVYSSLTYFTCEEYRVTVLGTFIYVYTTVALTRDDPIHYSTRICIKIIYFFIYFYFFIEYFFIYSTKIKTGLTFKV